jgi:hypothetical protein
MSVSKLVLKFIQGEALNIYFNHILTRNRNLVWKTMVAQLIKKFLAFIELKLHCPFRTSLPPVLVSCWHFKLQISCPLLRYFQRIRPSLRPFVKVRTMLVSTVTSCSPHVYPPSWGTGLCQLCIAEGWIEHLDKCRKKDCQYLFWFTLQEVGKLHKHWNETKIEKEGEYDEVTKTMCDILTVMKVTKVKIWLKSVQASLRECKAFHINLGRYYHEGTEENHDRS